MNWQAYSDPQPAVDNDIGAYSILIELILKFVRFLSFCKMADIFLFQILEPILL